MFNAPIPGQSLTSEPKNYAWERPPQYDLPEEALMFHLEKLDEPKKIEAVVTLLSLGLDIKTLTEGILRNGVAEGRHSIDVSLLIAPVVHEFILGVAKSAGVEYDEGLDEGEEIDIEGTRNQISKKKAAKILAKYEKEEEIELPEVPKEEPQVEEEVEIKEQPKGLMARGVV